MKEKIFYYLTVIPKGKVVTYKQIALYLGNVRLARVVGNILHENKEPLKYPCYKVVNSKGGLASGYAFGGIIEQKRLLTLDGIEVVNNKVTLGKYQISDDEMKELL